MMYFCDGLRNISISNGVVRLEFYRIENETSVPELTVALPIVGFAHALGVFEEVRDKLLEDGVIKPPISKMQQ